MIDTNYISRFLSDVTDNSGNLRSGRGTSVRYVQAHYPELFTAITDYHINIECKVDIEAGMRNTFAKKMYHFINKISVLPTCQYCKSATAHFPSFSVGYTDYCVKCRHSSNIVKLKAVSTNLKKYNVDNPAKSQIVKDHTKKTNINKYGYESHNSSPDVKLRKIESTISKYGVDNVSKIDAVRIKISESSTKQWTDPEIRDKMMDSYYKHTIKIISEKFQFLKIKSIDRTRFLTIECDVCSKDYTISLSLLTQRTYYITDKRYCTFCNPINQGSSINENELYAFVQSLCSDTERKNRSLIGLELDVYVPSKKIAIEYDGLYWHSELYKSKTYHLDKTNMCKNAGVQLIHVFEDDWIYKKDIVKSRISNMLGFTENRIYARNCEILVVSQSDASVFLDANHLQGKISSTVNIGLRLNGELVSIMSFGKLRRALGNKHVDGHFEMLRFCNKLGTTVVGGASRLLKYFVKSYNPVNIISYADKKWSDGNLYDMLGFTKSGETKPNYYYVVNNQRRHRFAYRKNVLVKDGYDANMSEHQIMLDRKIYRIYDCGNLKYTYK